MEEKLLYLKKSSRVSKKKRHKFMEEIIQKEKKNLPQSNNNKIDGDKYQAMNEANVFHLFFPFNPQLQNGHSTLRKMCKYQGTIDRFKTPWNWKLLLLLKHITDKGTK